MATPAPVSQRWRQPGRTPFWLAGVLVLLLTALYATALLLKPGGPARLTAMDNIGAIACEFVAILFCAVACTRSWPRATATTGSSLVVQLVRCAVPLTFGVGLLCTAIGDSIWAWYQVVLQRDVPVPSLADVLYLSSYPCYLLGILLLVRGRFSVVARARRVLDSMMILTAAVTFSWYAVLGPTLIQGTGSLAEKAVNVAYPLGDILLTACLVLLWTASLGRHAGRFVVVLVLAFLCLIVTDSVYDYQSLQGTYVTGELIDTGWPLSYLLLGLSTLLLGDLADTAGSEQSAALQPRRWQLWRDMLPYALLPAVGGLLIVTRHSHGADALSVGVDVGAGALVAMVVLRQVLALRESSEYARTLERLYGELSALHSDKSTLTAVNQQLEVLATTDTLTHLPNRGRLHERLTTVLEEVRYTGTPLALLLLDLDRFKEVNDTLGHDVGDQLLVQVADRLRGAVRRTDSAARLGGDEFAVLLPTADSDGAMAVTRAIRTAIESPFIVEGQRLSVGVSVGIALAPMHGVDAASLLRHADVAMYVAKRGGLGYAFYDPAQDEHQISRLRLIADLQQASSRGELVLYYQPKMNLESGEVTGVEALIRWQHPEFGLIGPDQFIPLAEQTGLIVPLTTWVLDRALAQCAAWAETGLHIDVAVNLSLRNLRDPQLCDTVATLLACHGVPAQWLCLELTESVAMADVVGTQAALTQLTALGVHISIDDFGTGYSSLSYLAQLPIDELKIDRSFVQRLAREPNNQTIVASTIGLGHALGLQVVTEGVEDESACSLLGLMGADVVQGYYLARPLPAEELSAWLRENHQPAAMPA